MSKEQRSGWRAFAQYGKPEHHDQPAWVLTCFQCFPRSLRFGATLPSVSRATLGNWA